MTHSITKAHSTTGENTVFKMQTIKHYVKHLTFVKNLLLDCSPLCSLPTGLAFVYVGYVIKFWMFVFEFGEIFSSDWLEFCALCQKVQLCLNFIFLAQLAEALLFGEPSFFVSACPCHMHWHLVEILCLVCYLIINNQVSCLFLNFSDDFCGGPYGHKFTNLVPPISSLQLDIFVAVV